MNIDKPQQIIDMTPNGLILVSFTQISHRKVDIVYTPFFNR